LESIARQSGIPPPELEPVDCPQEVKYIWTYWMKIQVRRTAGKPIGWSDLDAWARLNSIQLSAFEVDMLNRIESLYFAELRRQKEAK
jgi:hypothetical protein